MAKALTPPDARLIRARQHVEARPSHLNEAQPRSPSACRRAVLLPSPCSSALPSSPPRRTLTPSLFPVSSSRCPTPPRCPMVRSALCTAFSPRLAATPTPPPLPTPP